ncbi:MAG: argininosuccinate lyase [Bacteroidetes bacterium]|nr:argininosuccinate lyase [Bacteroidota bacterium]
MKLWLQNETISDSELLRKIERFTIGNDNQFDMQLAICDVQGSLAHARMLASVGLLTDEEWKTLEAGLTWIMDEIRRGQFCIEDGVEDIHSQVELTLTRCCGEVGKKIHSGRSRNDQALLDIKLFLRQQLRNVSLDMEKLFVSLISLSEKHKKTLLPGYTHLQLAMPSSFGLWFGAYAESLADDLEMVEAAFRIVNKNPLGSGAGYGSSFPLNRGMTTELLGFSQMNYNVVYAQMTRGKSEKMTAVALAAVASTLGRLAMDVCLYMNQNFGFVSFPRELTTGSSIMPHKQNPDVFELIRAKCNRIQALPNELTLLQANLTSGYHRDMQLTKACLFPAIQELKDCLEMTGLMLLHIKIREDILSDERYKHLFTVEYVNELVLSGMPFRDAYHKVGHVVKQNTFEYNKELRHTHEGSLGNLCNDKISESFYAVFRRINAG